MPHGRRSALTASSLVRRIFFLNRALATKIAPPATALCGLDGAPESAGLRKANLVAPQRGVLAPVMLE
jgi:hypothetical protein